MRVGITGHRDLPSADAWEWVEEAIGRELETVGDAHLTAVSSLARGADQRFAMLVVQRGGDVHAVIPFAGYERTLSGDDLAEYRRLTTSATAEVLRTDGADEDAYLAAGKRVSDLSDVLFAVWDGQPARGKGGTGDIVAYAVSRGRPVVHINPRDRTVAHLG
jgi:hypothetical protein